MRNEDLTNLDVVLYALFLLDGVNKRIFTEEIALKSFKLTPSRFSWRRYTQYPDIEPARRILIFARDEKNLVSGRYGEVKGLKPSDGWIFSPKGILWIENNKLRISESLHINPKSVIRTDRARKINELENSTAFKKYLMDKSCKDIKPYEFTDFLNASLDTPSSILRVKIDKISALAASSKYDELLSFINECKIQFSNLLKQ